MYDLVISEVFETQQPSGGRALMVAYGLGELSGLMKGHRSVKCEQYGRRGVGRD